MPDSSSIHRVAAPVVGDCLGRTCLKWSIDGELSARDFSLVMQRLAHVDPEVTALQDTTPEGSGVRHVPRPAAETLRSHGAT